MQELRQVVRDNSVVHRGGEQPFLCVSRQVGPYLQRGKAE
ncbi:hypothetical protein ACVWXN_000138 [Bradyrhizobium sp. i1.4.4]